MNSPGTGVLEIGQRGNLSVASAILTESIYDGTTLSAQLAEEAPSIDLRTEVNLSQANAQPDDRKITLWVSGYSRIRRGDTLECWVRAADPMGFGGGVREFSAHLGGRSLSDIATPLLSHRTQLQPHPPPINEQSPAVRLSWVLQCYETDAEFIRRLGRMYGSIPFWDGKEVVFGKIGRGMPDSERPIDLSSTEYELDVVESVNLDQDRMQFSWVNPATLTHKSISCSSSNSSSGTLRKTRVDAAELCDRPVVRRGLHSQHFGKELEAKTALRNLKLGGEVEHLGEIFLVDRIAHKWLASGSYHNQIHAVSAEQFGTRHNTGCTGIAGPMIGEVVANDDPAHRGRVRVRLLDDPERLPSHWVPVTQPAASSNSGWLWLPELRERVVLLSENTAPERLFVVGSVRPQDSSIVDTWRHRANGMKAFSTAGGMQVRLDDNSRQMELLTKEASLTLGVDGSITLRGKHLNMHFSDNAEITAGNRVKVDGQRIELGD